MTAQNTELKIRREEFDSLVDTEMEKQKKKSHDEKEIAKHNSDVGTSSNDDDSVDNFSSFDDCQSDISHDFNQSSSGTDFSDCEKAPVLKKYKNIFNENLNYRKRKIRCNKLDLGVVRDYCHEVCRMDTFNSSQKIQVHNYD